MSYNSFMDSYPLQEKNQNVQSGKDGEFTTKNSEYSSNANSYRQSSVSSVQQQDAHTIDQFENYSEKSEDLNQKQSTINQQSNDIRFNFRQKANLSKNNNLICDEPTFQPYMLKLKKQNTVELDYHFSKNENFYDEQAPQMHSYQNLMLEKQNSLISYSQNLVSSRKCMNNLQTEKEKQGLIQQQQQLQQLYEIRDFYEFLEQNAKDCIANSKIDLKEQTQDQLILEYCNLKKQENTFFKSVSIIHFKHMLYNDHIDIHNLSLFDMFERVKSKKMILKPSPIQHPQITQEEINDIFCTNIYTLIKLKTQVSKQKLFQSFIDMITNQPIFLEALMLMLKELVLDTIENDEKAAKDFGNLKSIIHHSWVEMKPEFLSLLSVTLNKTIEVVYILESRAELMTYDKLITRYNQDETKIKLVYYHSSQDRKSFYFPIIDTKDKELFLKKGSYVPVQQNNINSNETEEIDLIHKQQEQVPSLSALPMMKNTQVQSKLFADNLFDLPNTRIETKLDALKADTPSNKNHNNIMNLSDINNMQILQHSKSSQTPKKNIRDKMKNQLKEKFNLCENKCMSSAKKIPQNNRALLRDIVSFIEPSQIDQQEQNLEQQKEEEEVENEKDEVSIKWNKTEISSRLESFLLKGQENTLNLEILKTQQKLQKLNEEKLPRKSCSVPRQKQVDAFQEPLKIDTNVNQTQQQQQAKAKLPHSSSQQRLGRFNPMTPQPQQNQTFTTYVNNIGGNIITHQMPQQQFTFQSPIQQYSNAAPLGFTQAINRQPLMYYQPQPQYTIGAQPPQIIYLNQPTMYM